MMKSMSYRFLLCLALLTFGRSPAVAQDPPDTTGHQVMGDLSPDQLNDRAAVLLSQIRKTVAVLDRYRGKLESASSEDSLVLQRQISKRQIEALDQLHDMVDVLLDLEKSGPQETLRPAVEELCHLVVPQLSYHVARLRIEVDAARARRATVELSHRLSLEDEIGDVTDFLNQVYKGTHDHFAEMERLGLDVTVAKDSFVVELTERADELSGRLDLALTRISDLEDRHSKTPDDGEIPPLMAAVVESRDLNTSSLQLVLDILDEYDLHTGDYRTQLVEATKDISAGILDTDVAASLISRGVDRLTGWLSDTGPQFAVKLLLFLGILLGFYFASKVVRRATAKALDASKLNISQLLRRMIINASANTFMVLGLLIALSQLGISLGPLMAGIGVIGFILGFALQDTLSNFASGLMILLYRPYDVGDMVEVSGAFGKVDRMSLVSTTILTIDNQSLVIPNNKIWGDVIKNVTDQDLRRVDMVFGISYADHIPQAEEILMGILKDHAKILDDPEPEVHLHTLNDSSVDFVVRPWVQTGDYWTVYWDVTRAVKMRFDEEGVSIPFPQRDVHLYQQSTGEKNVSDES